MVVVIVEYIFNMIYKAGLHGRVHTGIQNDLQKLIKNNELWLHDCENISVNIIAGHHTLCVSKSPLHKKLLHHTPTAVEQQFE